jgi:hypothetical protein
MIHLYESFGAEARQAIFGALNDAVANGETEIGSSYLAASLLKTPSGRTVLEREGLSLPTLLTKLNAAPFGQGGYDIFQLLTREAENGGTPNNLHRLAIADKLVALRMSSDAAAAWRDLANQVVESPPESIGPTRVLMALLKHDGALRGICAESGLLPHMLS